MKFSVCTGDIRMFISTIWFIETLKNTNNHYLYLSDCTHYDEEENKILDFVSYDNDFTFEYNSQSLKFNRTRFGNPIFINSRCEAGQYEELTIEVTEKHAVLCAGDIVEISSNYIYGIRENTASNYSHRRAMVLSVRWSPSRSRCSLSLAIMS